MLACALLVIKQNNLSKANIMGIKKVIWIDDSQTIDEALKCCLEELGLELLLVKKIVASDIPNLGESIFIINTNDIDQIRHLKNLSSNDPIIARISRNKFDLVIKAMDLGVYTVFADDDFAISAWHERVCHLIHEIFPTNDSKIGSNAKGENTENSKPFVFVDPLSKNLLTLAGRVAKADVSVLLTGPTGAGKEVIARLIHESSDRYNQPFVAVNCAAMPENLIEGMLFGYEKGSFTGALKSQAGYFEQAEGGTIFLDEIGDMPYILQSKLLRVIQERQVQRLGSSKLRDLNIRIIAATNCDLKRCIAERSFREDLYFRLSAFKISIPPLRERPMDIMPLVHQFIDRNNTDRISKQVSLNAQRKLVNYHWPGNVRELENVVSRAIILAYQTDIDEEHISFDELQERDLVNADFIETVAGKTLAKQITASPTAAAEAHNLDKAVKNSECQAIIAAINSTPSRKEAAKRLGISPRTLRHKIQKLREDGFNLTHAYVI